jgi:hypothetical protein
VAAMLLVYFCLSVRKNNNLLLHVSLFIIFMSLVIGKQFPALVVLIPSGESAGNRQNYK